MLQVPEQSDSCGPHSPHRIRARRVLCCGFQVQEVPQVGCACTVECVPRIRSVRVAALDRQREEHPGEQEQVLFRDASQGHGGH